MPCVADAPHRVNHFGIETNPDVTYQGWEPGKEYTKNIVLKNVKVKTQKLTYNVPGSRFFSTLYPKQITLSAGTSFVLPVTFRPLEKNVYEDNIKFASKEGEFVVPIKAVLPQFAVASPKLLELPMCAVKDQVKVTFSIKNDSELTTPYRWEVEEPFTIEPAGGILAPFTSAQMIVKFNPTAALVYECQAKCLHGSEYLNSTLTALKGIGKYPHLLVACANKPFDRFSEASLDFGVVPIGSTIQKMVEIFNHSAVEAKCTIQQPSLASSVDKVYSCQASSAIVPAHSSIQVPVKYTPINVGNGSVDYLFISSISDVSKMTIKLTGSCSGPHVELSATALNFSLINVGESATRTVEISNPSSAATYYQFRIDCSESVFKLDCCCGMLQPGANHRIVVKFWPNHAINYYRRITCVVDNQAPLFLDLLGTAHSEMVKPAVLEIDHIQQFDAHRDRGLTMFPPEQLNEMLASGKLELDTNQRLMNVQAESFEPYLEPAGVIPPMDRYFNDGYHSDIVHAHPHVSLDTIHTDFGKCADTKNIEPKTVTLTNHTKGKIIVQWMGDAGHKFHVTPNTQEIPPLKTADFRVTFKPDAPNSFFGAELECYCYFKSLRDYRMVESISHAPPFCLTLTAVASTFQPNQQTFLPELVYSTKHLVFPAVSLNEPSYRTVAVMNSGRTPVLYDFSNVETFSVKPKKGIIRNSEVFVIRAIPEKIKTYRRSMNMNLNQDEKYTQALSVISSAETADLLLSNNGELYFKQTCVGASSTQTYSVKNISRMPLKFKWAIKHDDKDVLKAEPSEGIILPNERQEHTFTFIPRDESRLVMKSSIVVSAVGQSSIQSGGKPKAYPVRVVAQGSIGDIVAEESYVEFGNVMVGSQASQIFNICNTSDCALQYKLSVAQKTEGTYVETDEYTTPAFTLDQYEGVLAARAKKVVRGVVKPILRCQYQFTVSYILVTPECKTKESEPTALTEVYALGVFPLMVVNDARIHGSGIGISKKQLWRLFQLDSLNMFLDSDPSERELMYSVATRQSTRKRPPVMTRAIVDFNFGAAPLGSDPCYVTLHYENTGTVDCEWEFLMPSDLQIELEYWSETGEYTDDELHQMKVMDNQLFSIQPKKGRLSPGGTCAVTFTYNHLMAGTDRVPVLLKLSRGREILINFIGVTVGSTTPYIHYPSNKHMFAPVAIGEKTCPKQVYEMYNGGSVPLTYEIDTLPLQVLTMENFDHQVFECLHPKGTIAPGKTAFVEWRFWPLEAKTYQVDVPIHVSKGETALITFTGVGYDKKQLGETMPTQSEDTSSTVPATQIIGVPGQNICLSAERISFANLPLFSKSRKLIFMRNTSDHTMTFSWHVTSPGDEKIVNVYPSLGTLTPHSSQMIKVGFTSTGEPAFYDMDMICETVDETEMARYRRKLRDWEKERERQINEFTITEKDMNADMRYATHSASKTKSGISRLSNGEEEETVTLPAEEQTFKSYKTLPPILDRSVDKDRAIATEQKRVQKALWQKPAPPKPFLIHLGITARTHAISTFQENFADEFSNCFIDKSLDEPVVEKPDEDVPPPSSTAATATEAEGGLLSGVIANVLRSLVDDSNFHVAVQKLGNESVPYFNQFGPEGQSKAATPAGSLTSSVDQQALAGPTDTPDFETQSQVRRQSINESEPELELLRETPHPMEQPATTKPVIPSPTKVTPAPVLQPRSGKSAPDVSSEETIHRSPAFANVVEDMLENTLMNILLEASNGEVNLTARPRLIALPPRRGTPPHKN